MTAENRRARRMLYMAVLLISLPLTGFVWAMPENFAMVPVALALTIVSLAVGFGAEVLASTTENELQELRERAIADGQRRAEELASRNEAIDQFDRIIGLLTEQNSTLRSELVSAQVTLQRQREGLVDEEAAAFGLEDFAPDRSATALAH